MDTRDDQGSVLLLGVGFIVVCLLALTVVADVSAAFLQRQALMSLADSAALAGAQAIDVDRYYREGASVGTPLQPSLVTAAARQRLVESRSRPDVAVERIATDGTRVVVRLTAPLRLPFLGRLRHDVVRVEAAARLDYRPSR